MLLSHSHERIIFQLFLQLNEKRFQGVWSLEDKQVEEKRQHFHARVVQIVSGDTLVVEKEEEPKSELRVILSSIRAPKLATRAIEGEREAKKAESYSYEAKEVFPLDGFVGDRDRFSSSESG